MPEQPDSLAGRWLCCLESSDGPHAPWCTDDYRAEAGMPPPDLSRQAKRRIERERAKSNDRLRAIHQIDESHASALERIDSLVAHIRNSLAVSDPTEMAEALENPMLFIAITKMMEHRVMVDELPYMLAAAILRIAEKEMEGEG